jgi:hypothetical protein
MNADETSQPKPQPPEIIDLKPVAAVPPEQPVEPNPDRNQGEMGNWDTLLDEIAEAPMRNKPDRSTDSDRLDLAPSPSLEDVRLEINAAQASFGRIIQGSIADLERRRQKLELSIEQLERRREQIKREIDRSFAGASQDMAIRVQGFKDYLVGSLQDLVTIAEDTEFPAPPPPQTIRIEAPSRIEPPVAESIVTSRPSSGGPVQFAEPTFGATTKRIKSAIAEYRSAPDYYGPPWQLRRSLEPKQADKVSRWFFDLGGRGSLKGSSSRLQNITIAAGTIAILREIYGEDLRTLILANLPERLGDWRRGLQDCLGVSKSDFGGGGGIILFENPNALVQKADRIVSDGEMPLIIIDDSEGLVSLSLLQYPLWLAFIPSAQSQQQDDYR